MDSLPSDSAVDSHGKRKRIIIVKGNIAEFKMADVLVNPVTKGVVDLRQSGEIPRAFYKIGREELQKEFEAAGPPDSSGKALIVTEPAGAICARKIFHLATSEYRNSSSVELLGAMIKNCLKTAESYNLNSIAFPTLGCGQRGYDTVDVALCFYEAAKETRLKIYIVVSTDECYDEFRNISKIYEGSSEQPTVDLTPVFEDSPMDEFPLTQAFNDIHLNNEVDYSASVSSSDDEGHPETSPPPPPGPTSLHVSTDVVRGNADGRWPPSIPFLSFPSTSTAGNVLIELSISRSVMKELSPETTKKILSLQSEKDRIHIAIGASTIDIIGYDRYALHVIKQRVLKIMSQDELLQKNLDYIKRTGGTKEYLLALSNSKSPGFPHYWKNYTQSNAQDWSAIEPRLNQIPNGSHLYDAVAAFVLKTLDSRGGTPLNIVVKNIWTIENPILYRRYQDQLKSLALKIAPRPFLAFAGMFGEREILTKEIPSVNELNSQLISELNEVYLLHGSRDVEKIIKGGIDCRFCGKNGTLFGRGAYFAESSAKSDQYTGHGDKRYIFVTRVMLGQPFICKGKRPDFRKAPCSAEGCAKDDCTYSNHQTCDSVIGSHTEENLDSRFLFREFIVYHPEQCYPEFLVEYMRKTTYTVEDFLMSIGKDTKKLNTRIPAFVVDHVVELKLIVSALNSLQDQYDEELLRQLVDFFGQRHNQQVIPSGQNQAKGEAVQRLLDRIPSQSGDFRLTQVIKERWHRQMESKLPVEFNGFKEELNRILDR